MAGKHNCPNCDCKPACEVCGDSGFVSKSETQEPYDRGDGVMYGGGSWWTEPCPRGCPPPQVYYATGNSTLAPWCGICCGFHIPGRGACTRSYSSLA